MVNFRYLIHHQKVAYVILINQDDEIKKTKNVKINYLSSWALYYHNIIYILLLSSILSYIHNLKSYCPFKHASKLLRTSKSSFINTPRAMYQLIWSVKIIFIVRGSLYPIHSFYHLSPFPRISLSLHSQCRLTTLVHSLYNSSPSSLVVISIPWPLTDYWLTILFLVVSLPSCPPLGQSVLHFSWIVFPDVCTE